jgi:hypothetical protein
MKLLKKLRCWIWGHDYECVKFSDVGYYSVSEYTCKKCNTYKKYSNF